MKSKSLVKPAIITALLALPAACIIGCSASNINAVTGATTPSEVNIATERTLESDMAEDIVFADPAVPPKFMGGDLVTFRGWVQNNLRYREPDSFRMWVVVQFCIDESGDLVDIEILRSPDKMLSDETVRVLSLSPKWEPGYNDRMEPVKTRHILPVIFSIH